MSVKYWTEEEICQLKELKEQGCSVSEIAHILGRTETAIKNRCTLEKRRNGVAMVVQQKWTPEEDEILKECLRRGLSYKKIAKRLKRTISSVRHRTHNLKLAYGGYQREWTKEDDITFREGWSDGNVTITQLAQNMNRSYAALKKRAIQLGLGKKCNLSEWYTTQDIIYALGVRKSVVEEWFTKGKLKGRKRKVSGLPWVVTYTNLLLFLKSNLDVFDGSLVDPLFLLEAPSWFKEKCREDTEKRKAGKPVTHIKHRRLWSDEEDRRLIALYEQGHSFQYLANEFGRSRYSIQTHICRINYHTEEELKRARSSHKHYTKEEIDRLRELTQHYNLREISKRMHRTERSLEAQCLKYNINYSA